MKENIISETMGSHDSEDGDENTGLKLSGESGITSYEDSDEDSNNIFPFADHYAEGLVGCDKYSTNQLEVKIHPKAFEENKIMVRSSSDDRDTLASSNLDYQISKVVKRKPNFFKKVFLCQ
jgi:hypothetical protein